MIGASIGTRTIVDDENLGDIDLDIATISGITAGDGGIYLSSVRDLRLETIANSGALEVLLDAGDLALAGTQSVDSATIEIISGGLTQLDGQTLTALGANGAGSIDVTVSQNIAVSRMTANNGDVSLLTTRGEIKDNSSAEGTGQENLVINNGTLSSLSATAIGNRFEQGALDVASTSVGDITSTEGGVFINFTGMNGAEVAFNSVTATSPDADIALSAEQGGLAITTLDAARDLSVTVAGDAGHQSILLGDTTVGRTLTLSTLAGDIAQTVGTSITADGTDALSTLSAGGDIDLDAAGNDFARLSVQTGADVTILDRDALDLHDVRTSGSFELTTGDQLVLREAANVQTGGALTFNVTSGALELQDATILNSGTDIALTTTDGDFTSLAATQITAGGGLSAMITGDITFEDTTDISALNAIDLSATGDFSASGTTTLTSTSGVIDIDSTLSGDITLTDTTQINAKGNVTLLANDGDIALSGNTTLSSDMGTATLSAKAGKLSAQGTSVITGDAVTMDVQNGLTLTDQTSIIADAGVIDATVALGDIDLSGTSTLVAQTDLNIAIAGLGDIALSGASSLTATTGTLTIDQLNGDLSFQDRSTLNAGTDIDITLTDGDVTTSSATTLKSDADITINVESGTATLIHRSVFDAGDTLTLNASDGVAGSGLTDLLGGQLVRLDVATGDGIFINTTKVESGQGNVDVSIDTGSLSISDETSVVADKVISVTIVTGDLSLADTSTITAGSQANVTVDTGDISLSESSAMTSDGALDLTLTTGSLDLSDAAQIAAKQAASVTIETGDLSLTDTTKITSGTDASIAIGTGNLGLIENTRIGAGRDLGITLGTGQLTLNDATTLSAGSDLGITIMHGSVTMEDTETLITARDITLSVLAGLTPNQPGNVQIDLIQALNSTRIEALDGAILDNTASEIVDNIVSPVLNFVASDGIGVAWEDNLNVNTQTLTALNTRTGGINIQNRTGMNIGLAGVRNLAAGDVVLIAQGPIEYQNSGYSAGITSDPFGIFTIPGQSLILLSNHFQPQFDSNWGNTSLIQVKLATSASSATAQNQLFDDSIAGVSAFLGRVDIFNLDIFAYGFDAFDRFLKRFDFDNDDEEELRPIRMADFLLQNVEDSIALAKNEIDEAIAQATNTVANEDQPVEETAPEDATEAQEDTRDTAAFDVVPLISPDLEEALVIEDQASDTSPTPQTLDRPVILQAMLLGDDEIDMPLIAAE